MIGVFDSGRGGVFAAKRIAAAMPRLDIAYLADRKNAPFGNKSQSEILSFAMNDIDRLISLGAEKILIACCTASTVFEGLPEKYRRICLPIIKPVARRVSLLGAKRIGIVATEATVRSRAFDREIKSLIPEAVILSLAMPSLVYKVEAGLDTAPEVKIIKDTFTEGKCDALVLGCTHFSAVKEDAARLFEGIEIIDSAEVAADEIINKTENKGTGKILYM